MCSRHPDFELKIYLVPYGYQADILFGGDMITQTTRDFTESNYDLEELMKELRSLCLEMLNQFRANK